MVHKMRLPKKVVIYPRGFYKESAEGFMGDIFPKEVFVRIPAYKTDPEYAERGSVATHETMHQVWRKLNTKEKVMFMKKMGKVEKLSSELKGYNPVLQAMKKTAPKKDILSMKKIGVSPEKLVTATETFPRMGAYWVWGY